MTVIARLTNLTLRGLALVALCVAAVCVAAVSPARAADPVEVFIDARDPAFVVVQGVAVDTADQARREMEGYATLAGVSLVSWEAFRADAQAYIRPHVVKDDYPDQPLAPSLVALLRTYPGRPFAVTWNGGLAVSFMDYQHAVTTYQAFNQNAEAYESARPADPGQDPLNPANHLPGLLNR